MLKKSNRLKKKEDFDRVLKEGKAFKESFLLLKIKKNKLISNRFGFIISQKVSKKAVARNKIKRRLSELIRINLDKLKKGIDGIFIVLPGLEKKSFKELKEIIINIFKKAELFKND